MIRSVLTFSAVALILTAPASHAQSDSAAWVLKTGEEAISAALQYTGFGELLEYSVDTAKATLRIAANDRTPFLRGRINGRQCWVVEMDARLKLEMKFPPERSDDRLRQFSVVLDAETGKLVRISSIVETDYKHRPPLPSPEDSERILKQMQEVFHSHPKEPPIVSFLKALNYVDGSPFKAKEIYAWYVVYSSMGHEPHPVWWIDLRGIPPVKLIDPNRGGNTSIEKWNHMRSVIDARTGRHIRSSNLPG